MRIAIGCDDIGFPVKTSLIVALESGGHVVLDLGSFSTDPVDYPDYARVVGQAVLRGFAEAGVLVCASGVGASIAANKLRGVRAAFCPDVATARQSREQDDANHRHEPYFRGDGAHRDQSCQPARRSDHGRDEGIHRCPK